MFFEHKRSYRHEYKGEREFESYKDKQGNQVYAKVVEINPRFWKSGGYLEFRYLEKFLSKEEQKDGSYLISDQEREVTRFTIYDTDSFHKIKRSKPNLFFFIPSGFQSMMITGIAKEEITGEAADSALWDIFYSNIVKTKAFKEFLPLVHEYYIDFERKAKKKD